MTKPALDTEAYPPATQIVTEPIQVTSLKTNKKMPSLYNRLKKEAKDKLVENMNEEPKNAEAENEKSEKLPTEAGADNNKHVYFNTHQKAIGSKTARKAIDGEKAEAYQ